MTKEWRALERAGEWADLSGESLEGFILTVQELYNERISTVSQFESFGEEYYRFLNEEVFSDSQVVALLESENATEKVVTAFQNAEVPVEETYREESRVKYDFDEIPDMIMLLKLIESYSKKSEKGSVPSRYHLQKLVFLVDYNLKDKANRTPKRSQIANLGLLQETGYRYAFEKHRAGPFSAELRQARNRLFAAGIVDETPIIGEGTGEVGERDHRFAISLSEVGEMFVDRFKQRLHRFDSVLLSDWNQTQEDVIRETVDMSPERIQHYLLTNTDTDEFADGTTLLSGRRKRFNEDEIAVFQPITEVISHV